MTFVNKHYILQEQIANALQDPGFRDRFRAAKQAQWEEVVSEHLEGVGIVVTVLAVAAAPDELGIGEYLVDWQTDAGGSERNGFSPTPPHGLGKL